MLTIQVTGGDARSIAEELADTLEELGSIYPAVAGSKALRRESASWSE